MVSNHDDPPDITAAELVSESIFDRWPDIIPVNVVVIMDALTSNNERAMFAMNNTDCPPWVLQGMLNLISKDVEQSWQDQAWQTSDFDDDSGEV